MVFIINKFAPLHGLESAARIIPTKLKYQGHYKCRGSYIVVSPDYSKLEAETRKETDQQLYSAGWVVQDKSRINLFKSSGVAVREMDTDELITAGYDEEKTEVFIQNCQQFIQDHKNEINGFLIA